MHRFRYFSKREWALFGGSVACILGSAMLFNGGDLLSVIASLIGVTSLIFCAKGHPIGQALMLLFSAIYGFLSYRVGYYGEMITYLGMTAPMALLSLISWLKHPYQGQATQVAVASLSKREAWCLLPLTAIVTGAFWFILQAFHTAALIPSTISVATSFAAAYLTFRRSPYFALVYAANDLVLLVLWGLACVADRSHVSVFVCFAVFFINDIYGFISWRQMAKSQRIT